jgi:catechol 2,3-dioxygenase-like lactoylglutathione lyase family enzyme
MKAAATLYVMALDAMTAFYTDALGFEVVDAAPGEYAVLESASWVLSLVRIPSHLADAVTLDVPPRSREATPIKLTFEVASLEGPEPRIVDLGGRVEGHVWEFRGFRHRDLVDPEGNVGLLREAVAPSS